MKRTFLTLLLLAITRVATAAHTNIVLILADDFGWTDLACYGSELYESPNIDQLAREGMKFTQAYSACTVCSPTRAALLTGKYPARLRVTDWIPGQAPSNAKLIVPDWTKYLPLEEKTLAEELKSAGYATGSMGKWHLGGEAHYPEKQGFEVNIAGTHAPQPGSYFAPYKIATIKDGADGEYITDRLADEAVKFIETNRDRPFFLYLPHFAVHLPLQGKQELIRKYRAKIKPGMSQTNAVYAAMIESMDASVGKIRRKLAELKLTDNTVIVFTSDNGGRVPTTSNLPLRVGKGSGYEGGTRVPLIISWPGVTTPGSLSETPVITMDIFPTVLEAASLKSNAPDGISLKPILSQKGAIHRDELYWHYPHYQHYQLGGTTPYGAIRKGDFKLIEYFDDMRVELYNLRTDIGEKRNLAAEMSEKVEQLRALLHAWRREVGAQMPARNPDHDPTKPEHTPAAQSKKAAATEAKSNSGRL
jgi:arylsulfatase A